MTEQQLGSGAATTAPNPNIEPVQRLEQPRSEQSPSRDQPDRSTTKPVYLRPWFIAIAAILLLIILYIGGRYAIHAYHHEWTDDAFLDGHVVQLSPQVPGYVVDLKVTDNQLVHQGDVLLVIDQRDYLATRDQARAAADAAHSRVREAKAQVETSQANLDSVRATATTEAANLKREKDIFDKGASSKQAYDEAVKADSNAASAVTAAESSLASAELHVAEAVASARQADADLKLAELKVEYTTITAPITGHVTHRSVEQGDYLQTGEALFAIVDPNLWVVANFKETQLTHLQVGQSAQVKIDAYPGRSFTAHVDSFQRGSGSRFSLIPAENATGNYVKIVQRVPVKLVFDQPLPDDLMVGPGMSVIPDVRVR